MLYHVPKVTQAYLLTIICLYDIYRLKKKDETSHIIPHTTISLKWTRMLITGIFHLPVVNCRDNEIHKKTSSLLQFLAN